MAARTIRCPGMRGSSSNGADGLMDFVHDALRLRAKGGAIGNVTCCAGAKAVEVGVCGKGLGLCGSLFFSYQQRYGAWSNLPKKHV